MRNERAERNIPYSPRKQHIRGRGGRGRRRPGPNGVRELQEKEGNEEEKEEGGSKNTPFFVAADAVDAAAAVALGHGDQCKYL